MIVPESCIVSLTQDVRHIFAYVLHAFEGNLDEGQQPHHPQQISTSRVVLLELLRSLQLLVVASIVHNNVLLHFHFDETEEPSMPREPLVVFVHDSDFVFDIRESYAQEGIDEFECLAELVKDFEELIERHLFGLVVLVQQSSQQFHNGVDFKLLGFFLALHSN